MIFEIKIKNEPISTILNSISLYKILSLISISLVLILINSLPSIALECSKCHVSTNPIKANATIDENACFKCHNPNFPPTPIGYNTHLVHVKKYSVNVNYLSRHPNIGSSYNCASCHLDARTVNCQNCHVVGIPHIQGPQGENCVSCHNQLDNLFRHPSINLKIHNIFDNDNRSKGCLMCHSSENKDSLMLANGQNVPISQPHKLCFQCHGTIYNQWDTGKHHVNRTISAQPFGKFEDPAIEQWRDDNTCTNCHNPHNPSELYMLGSVTSIKSSDTIPWNLILLSITILLISIISILIWKLKKSKIDKEEVKKDISYSIKTKEIFSRIFNIETLLKILPVSISIESEEEFRQNKVNNNIEVKKVDIKKEEKEKPEVKKVDEIIEKPEVKKEDEIIGIIDGFKRINGIKKGKEKWNDKLIHKKEKEKTIGKPTFKGLSMGKIGKIRGDLLFFGGLGFLLISFYLIFGNFIPLMVAISESMSPHIEKGDLILYTDIKKIDKIDTFVNKSQINFDEYGDVIVYKPFGQDGVTPYIHRAMYFVRQGEEMWPNGPKAPTDGYITKGDNVDTNSQYDQQLTLSYQQPVKKEWILGIARFRIPYVGYIRLLI